MQDLIEKTKAVLKEEKDRPFSVYTSVKEQRIFNVPIIKPLLIFILSGCKKLGVDSEIACPPGSFVFLSNSPNISMRNIPDDEDYFAILIEFDFSDFDFLKNQEARTENFFQGNIDTSLERTLLQFVEWSDFSPSDLWSFRRQEILKLMHLSGYDQVGGIMESPSLSHKLHSIISEDVLYDLDAQSLSSRLAMSESTLRRKLKAEGTSLQDIKDGAKLTLGLHLIQSSLDPIGRIADQCGYHSQSRFSEKFKQRFGISPSELRKTRLSE